VRVCVAWKKRSRVLGRTLGLGTRGNLRVASFCEFSEEKECPSAARAHT
jgi:hypothetical protein